MRALLPANAYSALVQQQEWEDGPFENRKYDANENIETRQAPAVPVPPSSGIFCITGICCAWNV
ncbi:hypothetical protein [Chitinophaga rhizosphaerae]|uniref:hypothetical protein n=1 Tax=Chitinophaga rhizosphaerae TaxID=1864947 RepID=UPI000F805CEC|nr:hypothetical protein [Chitinophaga rhizosphaerae]